ncbi:MAG: hypothetical protein ACREFX_06525 [Opitutaceae bacterium]
MRNRSSSSLAPRTSTGFFTAKYASLLAGPILLTGLALAQTAPPPSAAAANSSNASAVAPVAVDQPGSSITANEQNADETVQLSPFEVTSEKDTGYLASSMLSGTRLRTSLNDIAAPISVITKDFMQDVNANDLNNLLIYTLGTEVSGPGGNFSGGTVGAAWSMSKPSSNTPIRRPGFAG